jgi:hypothetical protein
MQGRGLTLKWGQRQWWPWMQGLALYGQMASRLEAIVTSPWRSGPLASRRWSGLPFTPAPGYRLQLAPAVGLHTGVVVLSACLLESSPGIQPQLVVDVVGDDVVTAGHEDDVGQDEVGVVADVRILYLPQDRKFTSCLHWSPQDRRGAGQDHPQGPRGSLANSMGPTIAAPTEFRARSLLHFRHSCAPVVPILFSGRLCYMRSRRATRCGDGFRASSPVCRQRCYSPVFPAASVVALVLQKLTFPIKFLSSKSQG